MKTVDFRRALAEFNKTGYMNAPRHTVLRRDTPKVFVYQRKYDVTRRQSRHNLQEYMFRLDATHFLSV